MATTDTQHVIAIPASAATFAGFRAWATSASFPETSRISYINSEVLIDVSLENIDYHALIKAEISRVINSLVRELDIGTFYPDGTLLTHAGAGISTEPDAMFISWESFEQGRAQHVPSATESGSIEIEGTPDWVLEVVSPSSVKKDTQFLRTAYHAAGAGEYWIIDARGDEISFDLLAHQADAYVAALRDDRWPYSPTFGREFHLCRERDRMDRWQYTLEFRDA